MPTNDIKPVFMYENGQWAKQDAFEFVNGQWVRISTKTVDTYIVSWSVSALHGSFYDITIGDSGSHTEGSGSATCTVDGGYGVLIYAGNTGDPENPGLADIEYIVKDGTGYELLHGIESSTFNVYFSLPSGYSSYYITIYI